MPKTYVITGANQGIGLEFAKQLCGRGDKVYGTTRSAEEPIAAIGATPVSGVEMTNDASLLKLAETVEGPVDILIWNAAIFPLENCDRLGNLDSQKMLEVFKVNTVAPMIGVQAFANAGKLKEGSIVVLVSTLMGSIADNSSGGKMAYRMSKAALNQGGKCLSFDLKEKGISVCLIHPGFVSTNMVEQHGFTGGIPAQESVELMLQQIDKWDMSKTGQFMSRKGEISPW